MSAKMQEFCGMCHSSKVDPGAVKGVKIFNSMDERAAGSLASESSKKK